MGTIAGMLAQARALIGLAEYPPGSDHNKVTVWYGFDGPWCDMAISYEAGHSNNLAACMGKFAYTVAHAEAFQAHSRWHYGLGGARAGDVVFFDWEATGTIAGIDHVGLIEAVHSNGTITTLEGNTSDMFLRRVRSGAVIVGYGRPTYADAAPMPGSDGILRVGSTGQAVMVLQTDLNKVMSSGLVVDGDFGQLTLAALEAFQRKYHLPVDGEYAPDDAKMMQAALAGKTAPVAPTPAPPPAGTLPVDGVFSPATCAAMQRALDTHGANLVVDAAFGPLTKAALQRYLGVTADGVIGPVTIKALQQHVGATQSGNWDADTTKHLQTALNNKTF